MMTSCVDLGVTFSHNLDFKDHINKIVSRARQRICMLFRGFTSRNIDILMRAFIVYIRPVVEYNSVVWNPCTVHLIDILESVQRSFTKRIPSISKLTCTERLAHLNLDTLELRRLRFDLIFYYKVFNHLTSFDPQTRVLTQTKKKNSRSFQGVFKEVTCHFSRSFPEPCMHISTH
jgi:hypothetical protein